MDEICIGMIGVCLVVGIVVGMTEIGGGVSTTPALIYWVGLGSLTGVGTDLVFMVILKALATWLHQLSGNIDGSLVRQLCVGSVTSVIAGLIVIVILHWIAG